MPRQQLDLTNPITQNNKATPYMEALFYEVFAAVDTSPIDVTISGGVASVDLTKGGQFNITATSNFAIVIEGVANLTRRVNVITITNPAGAFDLTGITSAGVSVYKLAGSTISTLGGDLFSFLVIVPRETQIHVVPYEMEPV